MGNFSPTYFVAFFTTERKDMKELIVTIGLVLLGGIIFMLIMGQGDGTLFSATKNIMVNQSAMLSD